MSQEPNNIEATVFVYEHQTTGEVRAHYAEAAIEFHNGGTNNPDWKHVATLEPRLFIQTHYKAITAKEGPQ